jgi:hypothetical protein
MPTAPKYDPMSFAQITGGVPIPSWVFNQPVKSINDYQQQEQQLQYQDGLIRAQQDKDQERQAFADARQQEDPQAAALNVLRQYEPEKAFAMDLDERRMKRQEERDQVQMFQGLLRENPMLAQQFAQSAGLSDKLGIGDMDLSQMGGDVRQIGRQIVKVMPDGSVTPMYTAPRDEPIERARHDVFFDTTQNREVIGDLNDPATIARFNRGELQSQRTAPKAPTYEQMANEQFSYNMLKQMGVLPENAPPPISPMSSAPNQPMGRTSVEQKVQNATQNIAGQTPAPSAPISINGAQYMKVPGGYKRVS